MSSMGALKAEDFRCPSAKDKGDLSYSTGTDSVSAHLHCLMTKSGAFGKN